MRGSWKNPSLAVKGADFVRRDSLVSMIVPVYNKRDYLETCVNSLRAQTYTNLEIILVDDGSADGSGELCDAYAREDSRIRVIHQPNCGASSARNTGLDAAGGDYLCFVDADDRVLDTMVSEMAAVLEGEGCDLCVGGIMVLDEKDEFNSHCLTHPEPLFFQFPTPREKHQFLCQRILYSQFGWSACTQLFRRDTIEQNHLRFETGQKIYEDMDFFFRYVACCRNFRFIPKTFYIYRQHGDSAIHTAAKQERIHWMLCLARLWERTLEGQSAFPPSYICAGVICVVCGLLNDIPRIEADQRQIVQAFDAFRASENGEWLLGQARLAVRNRDKIILVCGWGLGLRVYGFYKSILSGNMAAFNWVNQLRKWNEILFEWKELCLPDKNMSP